MDEQSNHFYQSPIISDLCESLGIDLMDNLLSVDDFSTTSQLDASIADNGYTSVSGLSSCMLSGQPTMSGYNINDQVSGEKTVDIAHHQSIASPGCVEDDVVTLTMLTPESSPVIVKTSESDNETDANQMDEKINAESPGYVIVRYHPSDDASSVLTSGHVSQSMASHSMSNDKPHGNDEPVVPQPFAFQPWHVTEDRTSHDPCTRQSKRVKLQPGVPINPTARYAKNYENVPFYQQLQYPPMTQNMYYQMCWERYRQLAMLAHTKGLHKLPQQPQPAQRKDRTDRYAQKRDSLASQTSLNDAKNYRVHPDVSHGGSTMNMYHDVSNNTSSLDTSNDGDVLERQCRKIPSPGERPCPSMASPVVNMNDRLNRQCLKIPSPAVMFNQHVRIPSPAVTPTGCSTPDSGYSTPVTTPILRHDSAHPDHTLPGSYILTSTPMHTGLKRRHSFTDDSGFVTDDQLSPPSGATLQSCRVTSSEFSADRSMITLNSLNTHPIGVTQEAGVTPCQGTTHLGGGGRRGRNNIPLNENAVRLMSDWYSAHIDNPYPDKKVKDWLAKEGNVTLTQVKSWFANKRTRSNNTRPKIQQLKMKEKLMDICHQLTSDQPTGKDNNSNIIKQLSHIVHQSKSTR